MRVTQLVLVMLARLECQSLQLYPLRATPHFLPVGMNCLADYVCGTCHGSKYIIISGHIQSPSLTWSMHELLLGFLGCISEDVCQVFTCSWFSCWYMVIKHLMPIFPGTRRQSNIQTAQATSAMVSFNVHKSSLVAWTTHACFWCVEMLLGPVL